jgi:dienelactone hydrolase
MLMDIKAAMNFLKNGPERDKVDSQRIGLVGASIGANLAIMAGAGLDGLKCTAALSPGRSWHGLQPLPYAPDVAIPTFIAYAKGDGQSAEVIPDLIAAFGDNEPEVMAIDGKKHGTDMLTDGLDRILLTWLKEQLSE